MKIASVATGSLRLYDFTAMGRRSINPDERTFREKVAARIRHERIKAGFATQQELADAMTSAGLPTTKAAVSNWETAKRLPELETLWFMARLMGIPITRLLP